MTHRGARGFTLLEAIVALVIMGAALIPLLAFMGDMSRALFHAATTNEQSFAQQAAVAMLDPLNPMLQPTGQLQLDPDVTVSWVSTETVPPADKMIMGGALQNYRLAFYRVLVTLTRTDKGKWFEFEMRKVGYQNPQTGGAPAP